MDGFTARERATLAALCDAIVPRVEGAGPEDFSRRSASDAGVPAALEGLVLERLSPKDRVEFRQLLALVENPVANVVLAGRPIRFGSLTAAEREAYLLGLATSRLAKKRQAFQAIKKLTTFLFYALVEGAARNPNWPAIGYRGPDDAERRAAPVAASPLRTLVPEKDLALEADVVVVGSGAGGGVAAALAAQAGLSVIVVEAGGLRTARDFTGREIEGNRDLYDGAGLFATADASIVVLAGRTAGGGTTVNWMASFSPPQWLREEWDRLGAEGAATPEFEEHVRAVEKRLHVDLDESDVNGPNGVLLEGARALGFQEGADYDRIPRNALGCASRCDFCTYGCAYGAKQGTLVTYLEDAARAGARFVFDTRVERIEIEGGRARGVVARHTSGREVRVRARAVAVAGGAIQTAALLLRSGVRTRGVGRLFIHPATSVAARFPRPIEMWKGPMMSIVVKKFHNLDGDNHGPLLESVPGHPGLSASALPWRGGREHKQDMLDLSRTAALLVLVRDRDPGRVTLDARGEPRIHYRVSPHDAKHMLRGMEELARLERAAGADVLTTLHARPARVEAVDGKIRDADFDAFLDAIRREGVKPHGLGLFTAHQMGTAGIGPEGRAVTKPTGELWDVPGVWIVDGSAFPTPSGVNPMISILSLAHRSAGNMVRAVRGAPEAHSPRVS